MKNFITVYKPIAGWKPVMYWWNPDGFWEPWETYPFAFETEAEAVTAGMRWSMNEGIEFKPRSTK